MDLGHKMSEMGPMVAKSPKGKSYPSIHISGMKEKMNVGDSATIKGVVKRVTSEKGPDGSQTHSCDVECNSMDCMGGRGGLDDAMDKIAKKKEAKADTANEDSEDE